MQYLSHSIETSIYYQDIKCHFQRSPDVRTAFVGDTYNHRWTTVQRTPDGSGRRQHDTIHSLPSCKLTGNEGEFNWWAALP